MATSPGVLTYLVFIQGIVIGLYMICSFTPDWLSEKNFFKRKADHFSGSVDGNEISLYSKVEFNKRFKISNEDFPTLFIAILSHSSFEHRRNAIRTSWMKSCTPSQRVFCRFFTDGLTSAGKKIPINDRAKLEKESANNGQDLVIVDSASGTNFAVRLLIVMEYVVKKFDFDFFLRIDDDHFLCLDRLIKELPYRPKERLYWGFMHCQKGVTRIDEGWVLLTSDLVHTFITTKNRLKCGRFADQSLAMWIYDLMRKMKIHWYGDQRIFHHPPASRLAEFKVRKEICHTYISLHGSYPIEMRVFQLIYDHEKTFYGENYDIPPVIDICPYERRDFNWKWFDPKYYTQPVPCQGNPIWKEGGEIFLGRSIDIRSKLKQEEENEKRWKANMQKFANKTLNASLRKPL